MNLAVVAGAHGAGKTALLAHLGRYLLGQGLRLGVFKVDPKPSSDAEVLGRHGISAMVHVSGDVCPDHEALLALPEALAFGEREGLDFLVLETGGLCHRCSPFLRRFLACTVVSGLSNLATPAKMRPLLEGADLVVLTKAELISPAEREVFVVGLRQVARGAKVLVVNGLTGEGIEEVGRAFMAAPRTKVMFFEPLRAALPMGYCHFCQGIGSGYE